MRTLTFPAGLTRIIDGNDRGQNAGRAARAIFGGNGFNSDGALRGFMKNAPGPFPRSRGGRVSDGELGEFLDFLQDSEFGNSWAHALDSQSPYSSLDAIPGSPLGRRGSDKGTVGQDEDYRLFPFKIGANAGGGAGVGTQTVSVTELPSMEDVRLWLYDPDAAGPVRCTSLIVDKGIVDLGPEQSIPTTCMDLIAAGDEYSVFNRGLPIGNVNKTITIDIAMADTSKVFDLCATGRIPGTRQHPLLAGDGSLFRRQTRRG